VIRSEIVLTIPGTPAPKGSLRCRRNPSHTLYEDNPRTKPWREKVADAARKVQQTPDKGQPLDVEITFTFDRPKSVRRDLPASRSVGDVDKLVRTILDALQDGGALLDDAQVTDVSARKRYVRLDDENTPLALRYDDALGHPGVVIRINPI
jgi:Holliday junction resolvase RusA-like endonuclease